MSVTPDKVRYQSREQVFASLKLLNVPDIRPFHVTEGSLQSKYGTEEGWWKGGKYGIKYTMIKR